MRIAVVTYESKISYAATNVLDEDKILAEILIDLGLEFKFEIWSDTSVKWETYSHLLVKSPWDYFDRYSEFLDWCQRIKKLGIPVFNDIETILWNSDKRYLEEVQKQGFQIVPTRFLSKQQPFDLAEYFDVFKTDQLVLKPTVSGGAKNTIKLDREMWLSKKEEMIGLMATEDFMVQPFVKQIVEEGEYSYLYFNGKFSHAVLKSAKKGDFRVQHFFGGNISKVLPKPEDLNCLQQLVNAFAKNCLYARVDGVWIEGVFYLMELELIEPYLFLFIEEQAIPNYRGAIKEKLDLI
ncbi:RimK family alpha-L-glutamate ligase [Rhodonellum sp.]|uniref:ATP-grasp domain-containing protein n=1 Tax=Rhodonellum sp. TaxID=2231180 RepID=UPI00271A5821|nr:glutathione synthetase [Rhodonellum sp.]MDO9554756.1 glutathione synthetase [Rhodonellum sp.]